MSQEVFIQDGLIVADEILPPPTFKSLWREVSHGDYKSVHAQRWDKAWRLWDGNPLRGEAVYFDPKGAFGWKGSTYPTSTAVDALIDAVRRISGERPEVVGVEGKDWIALFLSPWLYPVGSGLALHQDAQRYSGSFTFFTHPRWGVHWGGELLVASARSAITTSAGSAQASSLTSFNDEAWEFEVSDENCDDVGIGVCVAPKPNRMALIGPDRPHRVTRVDQNAGTNVRASIAGFFLRSP